MMKRIALIIVMLMCVLGLYAQIDKNLKCFVDAVVLLGKNNTNNVNTVKNILKQNKKWTLMDELKDESNNECLLTKRMLKFNLNPILTKVLTERYGKNITREDYLGGEDSKFNYSLIEKGIKAKKKVKYVFQGRVGKQDFVIVPCDPTSILSIKFSKGASPLKAVQKKDKEGCIYLHIDAKLKSTDKITLEIENKSNKNVAIAIINHNTRK